MYLLSSEIQRRILYVAADGSNYVFDPTVKKSLESELMVELSYVRFDGQTGRDLCSSSAVLMAIEMLSCCS